MRLDVLELRRVELALRSPVGTAVGTHERRPVVYVRVVTDMAEGWGECGALVEGTDVDPPLDAVWAALAGPLGMGSRLIEATRHRTGHLVRASQVAALGSGAATARLAGAALEMAVLDAELRAEGRSLVERLGVKRRRVGAGAVVGIPADRELTTLLADVDTARARGYQRVRVKIAPGWDAVPVRAVRDAFPDIALQVDANGTYRAGVDGPDGLDALRALDGCGLTCIEQPLPPSDLAALGAAAAALETPVALDESLTSVRRLEEALRYGACEVACLKPARIGGLLAARRAQQVCAEAGVPAFVGGFFETGLARTANAVVAGLSGFTVAGDLSDPADYLDMDPAPGMPIVGGEVELPSSPGVGPVPDPSLLNLRTSAEVTWRTAAW